MLVNNKEKEILQTTSVIPFIIEKVVSPHPFNKERGCTQSNTPEKCATSNSDKDEEGTDKLVGV